ENGITNPNLISVGQQLLVPGGTTVTVAAAPTPAVVTSSTTYTVVAGDTLGGIAARHGTTVNAIVSANNLGSTSLIRVGQRLTIPGSGGGASTGGGGTSSAPAPASTPASARTHTVTAGDTLLGIASRYG